MAFRAGYVNVGLVEYEGIQSEISHHKGLGRFGDLNMELTHMYTDRHNLTTGAGDLLDRAGQLGRAKHRVNLNSIWRKGNWTWFNQIRCVDSVVLSNAAPENRSNQAPPTAPLSWAERLKRVFDIDISVCPLCGGTLRVIADVTDPDVIRTILAHLKQRAPPVAAPRRTQLNVLQNDLFASS